MLVSIIGLMFACSTKKQEQKAINPLVKIDTVRFYGNQPSVAFPGKVKASSDISIAFKVSGTILKMNVDVGSFVKKGQVLAEMDPRDYEIQLAATTAEYKQIKAEAERVIALYEKNSISENDYDKAVYGLQQITAKYNAHKNALNDTKLLAPFDGYVQKRLFEPNETVSAGIPVISLINASILEVETNIPLSEYIRRDRFESFSCMFDIFPNQKFPLDLIGITQKANMNQLYTMRLRFKNVNNISKPTPGMSTIVTINLKPEQNTLKSIPLSAMFEKNGQSSVWIYDKTSKTVKLRHITINEIKKNGRVIVSEGIEQNEIIVTAGIHSLIEGQSVTILLPATSTNIGGLK